MGDSAATLPFTVTNNSPSKSIREITFILSDSPTLYNFSEGTIPPSGWCIKNFSSINITFSLEQGGGGCGSGSTPSQINPGGSLIFNIALTGPNGGSIIAAASDVVLDNPWKEVQVGTEGGFDKLLPGNLLDMDKKVPCY